MKKRSLITITVIVAVIIFAIILINQSVNGNVPKSTAICIGENAKLYTKFGCPACETQENMFGTSYQYLNAIDCFFEIEECSTITHTPTWIINDTKYTGVQSIETLKELTGCD
jgi:hypothetical protein